MFSRCWPKCHLIKFNLQTHVLFTWFTEILTRSRLPYETVLWYSRLRLQLPSSNWITSFFGKNKLSLGEILSEFLSVFRWNFKCVFEWFLVSIFDWFCGFQVFLTDFFYFQANFQEQNLLFSMFSTRFFIMTKNVQLRVLAISVQHLVSFNYIHDMFRFNLPDLFFQEVH
jgi:hypothetical protein